MKYAILSLLLIFQIARVQGADYNTAIAQKNSGDFAKARDTFAALIRQNANDSELWFQYGLVLRYLNELQAARDAQERAAALAPNNIDIKLELARLHYYLGNLTAARHHVEQVSAIEGSRPEVQALAQQIDRALQQQRDAQRVWQADIHHEISNIPDRDEQWQLSFLRLSRVLDATRSVFIHTEQAERFDNRDYGVLLGGAWRISPGASVAVSAGQGFSADYVPLNKIILSGDKRIYQNSAASFSAWLTADVQVNRYQDQTFSAYKPGLRMYWDAHWDWQLHAILVESPHNDVNQNTGWQTRVGWQNTEETLRLFVGYADAPETDEALVIPVTAVYGGFRWQFSETYAVAVSAAQEKREGSFTRNIGSATFTVRF